MMKKVLILVIAFSSLFDSKANKIYSLSELTDIYFNIGDTSKSRNIVIISYGPVKFSFNDDFIEKLSTSYSTKLFYGFHRKRYFDNPNIVSHSSQFAYIENSSSHFKPKVITKGKLTLDGWGFGFGLKNGYGYVISKAGELLLNHEAAINWQRIDFEVLSANQRLQQLQNKFDEKFKFGYLHSGGFEWQFSQDFVIGVNYNSNIIFNNTDTKRFLQILLFDNLFQFWIEFFDTILREKFQNSYPITKWIYKNSISILFTKIRTQKEYFPFHSNKIPLNSNSFALSITYIFE